MRELDLLCVMQRRPPRRTGSEATMASRGIDGSERMSTCNQRVANSPFYPRIPVISLVEASERTRPRVSSESENEDQSTYISQYPSLFCEPCARV